MKIRVLCAVPILAAALAAPSPAAADEASVARGRYLVHIMDCTGCHTTGALAGEPQADHFLAGSDIGFGGSAPMGEMTGGVVYPPNLTPDPETGLGRWTDEQIIAAFRSGRRPDGRQLVPIMPWPSYAALTDEDARAIVDYLRTLEPVKHQVPAPVKPGGRPVAPYLSLTRP